MLLGLNEKPKYSLESKTSVELAEVITLLYPEVTVTPCLSKTARAGYESILNALSRDVELATFPPELRVNDSFASTGVAGLDMISTKEAEGLGRILCRAQKIVEKTPEKYPKTPR
jgi:hypothetical protein